jgi:hypothetical protein
MTRNGGVQADLIRVFFDGSKPHPSKNVRAESNFGQISESSVCFLTEIRTSDTKAEMEQQVAMKLAKKPARPMMYALCGQQAIFPTGSKSRSLAVVN